MLKAIEVFNKVKENATITKKKKIVIEHIGINKYIRQGDIYIRRIEKITGTKKINNRQLATGSTKGSRHMVDDSVELFDGFIFLKNSPKFIFGPQIKAKKCFLITHPEHADFILPAGNYQVSYQGDWIRQEKVRD